MQSPKHGTSMANDRVERTHNWLQLSDNGLEAVRVLFNYQVGKGHFQILLLLEEMGLLKFLKDAWVCQDWKVCQEFVDNWDDRSRTTTIHGTEIDANYNLFLSMTGLTRERKTGPLDRPNASNAAQRCAALFGVKGDNWTTALVTTCKDTMIRDLLLLLNKTLSFAFHDQQFRAPRRLILLLLEALDGSNSTCSWGAFVYDQFVAEVVRLQKMRRSHSDEIRTSSGPLMYYLYARSRRKVGAVHERITAETRKAEIAVDSLTELFTPRPEKTMLLEGMGSSTEDKHDAGRCRSVSSVQAPRDLTLPCRAIKSNKKRRYDDLVRPDDRPGPSTPLDSSSDLRIQELENKIAQKNEEIIRLQLAEIESRLKAEKMERLYVEEQKHVQECLKLHFASADAEEEVSDLRAKVEALTDQKREVEKKEYFLELQLADMRKRWETATVRAELAEIQAAEKSCLLLRLLPQTGQ